MRLVAVSILALAIYSLNVMAGQAPADPKRAAPTAKQVEDAKEAFAKIGGVLSSSSKERTPSFEMPTQTNDEHLKKIPNLPFSFGLSLANSQVTDAGMKEIANLKNLTSLYLINSQVTDVGMKEIADLKNLTAVSLFGAEVTDADGCGNEGNRQAQKPDEP
jgi:internalin A